VTRVNHVAFVADDFGLDAGINAAILRAHREGVLTGASLMMGQPGTAEAVEMARDFPGLEIGWHLHLCDSQPLTMRAWPWGRSPVKAGLCLVLSPSCRRRILQEISRQWQAFLETGLPCRFINSHHHLHLHPWVAREMCRVLGSFGNLWFRGGRFRALGTGESFTARVTRYVGALRAGALSGAGFPRCADSVWGVNRLHRMDAAEIRNVAESLPAGLHEFLFHPTSREGDADLLALLSLPFRPRRITP